MNKRLVLAIILITFVVIILGFFFVPYSFIFIKKNPQKDFINTVVNDGVYVKNVLVVGFNKDISQAKAEEILNELGLKFYRTKDVNRGMKFFEETGETFLVKVPDNQEQIWIEKITNIIEVKDASRYVDPEKVLVD